MVMSGMRSAAARALANPVVQSGLVLGGAAAATSFSPSLMPRPAMSQGLVSGGAMLAGFAAGVAAGGAVRALAGTRLLSAAPRIAPYAAVGGAGLALAMTAGVDRSNTDLPRASLGTAGIALATGAAAAGTAALLRMGAAGLADRLPAGLARYSGAAVGAAAGGAVLVGAGIAGRRGGDRAPSPVSRVQSIAAGAGAAALVGGLLVGVPLLGGSATRRMLGTATGLPRTAQAVGIAATASGLGVAGVWGAHRLFATFDKGNDTMEPAFSIAPDNPSVTGGPASSVEFQSLGKHGRRFVSEAQRAADITAVTGEPAVDAIRIYVGLDSAPDVGGRVAAVLAEMHRTGAFERDLIILASPSGTGFVNPIPIEAAEYMSRGNVATVTIQYGERPSVLSHDRIRPGRENNDALHAAVMAEVASMPAGQRPRVVMYGESLGAHTSQDPYLHTGTEALDARGFDGALWVGTPFRSKWHQQVLGPDSATATNVNRASIGEFDGINEIEALPSEERDALKYVLLSHDNDPVGKFGYDLLVQRPPWLSSDRPEGVDQPARWLPGVTFMQTLVDTMNATNIQPGLFEATGHDYRADLAAFVREAYDFGDISDGELARIDDALRENEVRRARRLTGE